MTFPERGWEKYINMLSAINNTASKKFTAYLSTHDIDTVAGRKAAIDYAYALATQYGESAAAAACEMYDAVAEASGVTVPPAVPAPTAPYGDVAKAVNGLKNQNADNETIGNSIGRLVKRAGADTTLQNAKRDGAEFAWVPHGDTCAFCLMLASNGWQKASKKTIKGDHADHIHQHCDCEFAIRFDGVSTVDGYDPDKYKEIWDNTDGSTWQEKLQNLRQEKWKEYYKENKAEILAHKREVYRRSSPYNIIDDDRKEKIEYNEVKKLQTPLSEQEIISKVSGGDMTNGSCTSAALAYIGNKAGFDVRDFRGGASCEAFSENGTIKRLAQSKGINGILAHEENDYEAAKQLLKNVKPGKEYLLSLGQHTTIVRKAERGYEYLELQHPFDAANGFTKLTTSKLKDRFKCHKTNTVYGIHMPTTSELIDIDEIIASDDFEKILGYINTDEDKQKKGIRGSAK